MIALFNLMNNHRTGRFLAFLLVVCYCFHQEVALCEQLQVISEGSIVDLSLRDYNVSNPNGESIEVKYILKPRSSCVIQVTSIPKDANFVLVQVHSYMRNMTLSYGMKPTLKTSVNGFNIGLLKVKTSPVLKYYLSYNSSYDDATILIAAQAYGVNAPIPGGCNMEFEVEISPFLKIAFNDSITMVDFAPASPFLPIYSGINLNPDNLCDLKHTSVSHKTYRLYIQERNFSEATYFNAIKLMMTKGSIIQNGHWIPDKVGVSPARHLLASYPGTGSVFVVIAETPMGSSSYVPAFTYSCNLWKEEYGCEVLTTTFSKVLCASIFFSGLFACFAAHRFFMVQLILLGFVSGTFVAYVLALNFGHSQTNALSCAIAVGCAVGVAFTMVRCFRGLPLFSLIVATSILGYLFASSVFYKLIDVFDVFQSDINYWLLFFSLVFLAPILMMALTEKANIIACSLSGSYAAVVSVDYYIGSNLRYIVVNTIRRATVPRFQTAIMDPPFQTKDALLIALWLVLAAAGVTAQIILVKGKPPYPAPCNGFEKLYQRLRKAPNSRIGNKVANETTPLLHSQAQSDI